MFNLIINFLVSFLSISPSSGWAYSDSFTFNSSLVSNSSYSSTEKAYIDNQLTIRGFLNYNSLNDYQISAEEIRFKSQLYYDDVNSWDTSSYTELVIIPSDYNQYLTFENFLANLRFSTYFENDYFVIYADLYDSNDDYWNPLDSVSISLSSSMLNEDRNTYRFNIENFENQVLDRISGKTLASYSDTAYWDGYSDGHVDGFNEGFSADSTAVTIFNGILNIALVPINFFLAIFNFEILGINISSFVSAILSVCLVIIVIRFITGKKQGD